MKGKGEIFFERRILCNVKEKHGRVWFGLNWALGIRKVGMDSRWMRSSSRE